MWVSSGQTKDVLAPEQAFTAVVVGLQMASVYPKSDGGGGYACTVGRFVGVDEFSEVRRSDAPMTISGEVVTVTMSLTCGARLPIARIGGAVSS